MEAERLSAWLSQDVPSYLRGFDSIEKSAVYVRYMFPFMLNKPYLWWLRINLKITLLNI